MYFRWKQTSEQELVFLLKKNVTFLENADSRKLVGKVCFTYIFEKLSGEKNEIVKMLVDVLKMNNSGFWFEMASLKHLN